MALTSISVVTMATLFLVVVATLAVQTVATRPASDGYTAAATIDKPVEHAGGEATTVATAKPAKESAKPTGGEATTVTTAKSAEENYAKAVETIKTADKYMKEAATETSPGKAAFDKKAADLLSATAEKAITLADKATNEGGPYVSQKNLEIMSAEIKKAMKPLIDAGDKSSPKFVYLQNASMYTQVADKYLKEAAVATSTEKAAASRKAANENFMSALIAGALAEGKHPPADFGTVFDDKAAKPTDTYTAKDVIPKEASPKMTFSKETYAAKDVAPKEAPPKEAYTAGTA